MTDKSQKPEAEVNPPVILPSTEPQASAGLDHENPQQELSEPKADDAKKATIPPQSGDATPAAENNPQQSPEPPATQKTLFVKKKVLWLVILLILLGWGATAGGAYWVYLQYLANQQNTDQIQNQLADVNTQVQKAISQNQSKTAGELEQFKQNVSAELKAIEREANGDLSKLASQIKEHQARLNGQQQRLASLSTTSREDWLLAEAEYLLKLANQRVLLERTPQNVVALLTRADEIIERVSAGLGDLELFSIRKLLAEEITNLNMVEPVDTQGIYLKLGALANAINKLPTLPTDKERFSQTTDQEQQKAKVQEPTASSSTETQESFIAEFKREMASLFLFIRNAFSWYSEDELANPIVSQQRLQLMQLNTRLLIEQAQIALLKEDLISYRESLKSASQLASQYYFSSPARTALITELNDLAQKNIAPELPNISQSLKLLNTYIASQHRLNIPSAGQLHNTGAEQ